MENSKTVILKMVAVALIRGVVNTGGFKYKALTEKIFGVLDKWPLIGGACWSLRRVGQTMMENLHD